MKKFMKVISLVLTFTLLSGLVISFAETSYTWNDIYITYDGRGMPWRPADKYVSMQNPPDFTWPYANNAESYDLIICKDENFKDVYKSVTGLTNNYYNFNETFQTGIDYWWSVKYYKADGESSWSEARRFRVDPDAYEYKLPPVSELLERVPSGHHPRVFTTDAEGYDFMFSLEEFKDIKNNNEIGKAIYESYLKKAVSYANANFIPTEPTSETHTQTQANSTARNLTDQMLSCACAYLLMDEGEERDAIGDFGIKAMLALAGWSYGSGSPTSYSANDQVHREIMYRSAIAYDWLYHRMNEAERKTVRDMIVGRVVDTPVVNLLTNLKKSPFDSHGWTTIGYLGITAYALLGDFGGEEDVAEDWLETILPFYSAVAPPWSTQDGGWSQGTDYWRNGTNSNKEFYDVMALGGVMNLYNKAWAKNEPVWMLYAFPKGSYGSFGDGANRTKSEAATNARVSMGRHSFFNDSGLARWLYKEQGGLVTSDMYNYYASVSNDREAEAPEEYPLSHAFTDIDWAVMTNDLEDTDRVQLTFKSSPYGSFNHSHADQNSFIIQAFGEKLAVKSGYYDSYHSTHDSAITRATFAHNSVTMDGGYGQQDDRFDAKGNLSQFVNGLEFDSVTGEAGDAYKDGNLFNTSILYSKALDKFDRNIIYIRPDVFIVVDDLDASGENSSSFEWWLNAEHEMTYTDTSATISEGDARLKADVLYPETTAAYYNTFTSPVNNMEYLPTGSYATANVQTRVSFATDAVQSTKMIVSMSVYEDGGSAKEPAVSGDNSSYIKLDYGDTAVYVSLLDTTETVVTGDGITFKGAAVTLNDTSIMLTNGTYLKIGGKELISANRAVTASMGLGQLCLSSDDDFNVSLDVMNDYLAVTDLSALKDGKGRALTSEIGVTAALEEDSLSFSADKGNYTILNGDAGVASPGQLKAENISVQKSGDGNAAVFWDFKEGRAYDIKIDNDEIANVSKSPYVFELTDSVQCVYIREKLGKIKGGWSEPLYVSDYTAESHDKVTFTELNENGKAYVRAETLGFPSYGNFNMYLGKYSESGKLTELVKAESTGNIYGAKTEKPESGTMKALLFGKDMFPLASKAEYNAENTDLLGIYIDGRLIEGFDNTKSRYEFTLESDRVLFPFITAQVADNTSKATVDYDFENLEATITVKAPGGTERKIILKFTSDLSKLHYVAGATDEEADFSVDTGTSPDPDGKEGLISNNAVGTLKFNVDGAESSQEYNVYTNMRGNAGGAYYGSRLLSDRPTNSGNQLEAANIPEELKGFDYFVFDLEFYNLFVSNEITDVSFTFSLEEDAEVVVVSCNEMEGFESSGFKAGNVNIQGRYMNTPGPEDIYYSRRFNNLDISLNEGGRVIGYDTLEKMTNVSPVEGYSTYEEYVEAELPKSSFTVVSSGSAFIVSRAYSYKYTKRFYAGEVTLNFDDMKKSTDRVIVVVKPKTPKAFYEK